MNGDRVLHMALRERTSGSSSRYLSGRLGRASLVAFHDRETDEPASQLFVSAPSPRAASAIAPSGAGRSPHRAHRQPNPLSESLLDESADEFGRA